VIRSNCRQCGTEVIRRGDQPAKYCSMGCKAEHQREAKPVTRDWLLRKYSVEGLDTTEIGAIVGRDPKSVWNWLKDFGIPTRPRGSNAAHHFPTGHLLSLGRTNSAETRAKIRDARLRDGGVPYLKNGVHHLKGKRGPSTPNWKGGVTPERQAFYATPEWKSACVAVWHRDDAKCRRCGLDHRHVDRSVMKFAVHHIVGFAAKELRAELSNLVLLCKPCHLFVHSRANVAKEFLA
jgi:hypothetical protein